MPQQLFLSHDSRDHALASALGSSLQRLTLGQVSVWHSSDGSGQGGLRPGHIWLDEIRQQLSKSKAVVTLLTPRSIAKPWLLFESGFGAANGNCDVIPVCVGIDSLSDVPFPLAMYQAYQLADYDSLKRFVEKLFAKYEIVFDEEMCRNVLADLIKKLMDVSATSSDDQQSTTAKTLESAIDDIKAHIDKRLLDVALIRNQEQDSTTPTSFSIVLDLKSFSPKSADQFLEVALGMSVQDVLDAIYYMIPNMPTFQYLNRWLLRDTTAKLNLVVREIGARIPAHLVFQPGSRWEVVKLHQPYTPSDSQDIDRWYGQ